jgi:hypothetical protein
MEVPSFWVPFLSSGARAAAASSHVCLCVPCLFLSAILSFVVLVLLGFWLAPCAFKSRAICTERCVMLLVLSLAKADGCARNRCAVLVGANMAQRRTVAPWRSAWS